MVELKSMVTVYSKPICSQCDMTKRLLDREGVAYETVDVTEDHEAFQFITSLGYKQAPVVVAGDDHWSGFQPDRILRLP